MTARTRIQALGHGLALIAVLAGTPALAGGFDVSLERPDAATDARLKGAVLVIHPEGCIDPNTAAVSVTAEGIVGGRRRSVSVPATRIAPGVFTIRHTWPSEGRWVLAIRGSAGHISGTRVVQCQVLTWNERQMPARMIRGDNGTRYHVRARTVEPGAMAREVEAALSAMAEHASANGSIR